MLSTATPPVLAQENDPAARGYYRVGGLPPGDTLNVRQAPSPRAPIMGDLADGQTVLATGNVARPGDSPWYQVNFQERTGWVSSAYLDAQRVAAFQGTNAPLSGTCGGTEPFWDARWDRSALSFRFFDDPPLRAPLAAAVGTRGLVTPSVLLFGDPARAVRLTLVLHDRACTLLPVDSHGYQTGLLLVERDGTIEAYGGCCEAAASSMAPAN